MTKRKQHLTSEDCWCAPGWGWASGAWGFVHSDGTVVVAPAPLGEEEAFQVIGARLKELREEMGVAQADQARRLGIRPQHVWRLEQGAGSNGATSFRLSLASLLRYVTALAAGDEQVRQDLLRRALEDVYLPM